MAMMSYASGLSDVPLIGETIGEMLERIAREYPDNEALVSIDQGIRWKYSEFLEKVDELALALMSLDVKKGDRVAIWAMNYAEWVLVQFATAKCGAIMVNINPAYRSFELEYALRQSEIHTLILQGRFKDSDYVGMFYEACPDAIEAQPGRISSEKFPFLRNVVFMGDISYNGMYTWDEFIAKGHSLDKEELKEREKMLSFDDPVNIQYTSGTTDGKTPHYITRGLGGAGAVGIEMRYHARPEIVVINPSKEIKGSSLIFFDENISYLRHI